MNKRSTQLFESIVIALCRNGHTLTTQIGRYKEEDEFIAEQVRAADQREADHITNRAKAIVERVESIEAEAK